MIPSRHLAPLRRALATSPWLSLVDSRWSGRLDRSLRSAAHHAGWLSPAEGEAFGGTPAERVERARDAALAYLGAAVEAAAGAELRATEPGERRWWRAEGRRLSELAECVRVSAEGLATDLRREAGRAGELAPVAEVYGAPSHTAGPFRSAATSGQRVEWAPAGAAVTPGPAGA